MKHINFKRALSVLLTLALTVTLLPVSAFAAQPWAKDLDGHWAKPAIEKCFRYGIMAGVGNGSFAPDRDITRAEFAAVINRSFGYGALGLGDGAAGAWYAGDVQTAHALGYMDAAAPDGSVAREEAAVILAGILHLNTEPADGASTRFADDDQISSEAAGAVLAMEQSGYVMGHNNYFMPKEALTRGQAAQMLANVFGVIVDSDDFDAQGASFTNVTIRKPGVTLKNADITGDLLITEGVGDGSVWLENVSIQGRMLVAGGGSDTIFCHNLSIDGYIMVCKPPLAGEQPVRFHFSDTSDKTVVFTGTVREIIINDDIIVIVDAGGAVTKFSIVVPEDPDAMQEIHIHGDAEVGLITSDRPVNITGDGNVGEVVMPPPPATRKHPSGRRRRPRNRALLSSMKASRRLHTALRILNLCSALRWILTALILYT